MRNVLGYEIRGALRTQGSAAGLQDWPVAAARPAKIERGSVAVSVPSGVRSASCEASCSSQVAPDGTAHFSTGLLDHQAGLSISVEAAPGAIRTAGPILADPPSALDKLGAGGVLMVGIAVLLLLIPVGAVVWRVLRRHEPPVTRPWRRGTRAAVVCGVLGAAGTAGLAAGALAFVAADRLGAGLGALLIAFGSLLVVATVWLVGAVAVLWRASSRPVGRASGGP